MIRFKTGLLGIPLVLFFVGCSITPVGDNETKKINLKKVIYTQSSDGGNNSLKVVEERVGGNQQIRVIIKQKGIESNITHQIDNSNFVMSIPLQDPTSAKFGIQTNDFEREKRARLESLLARYFPRNRFNVSLRIVWDRETLEEIQLKSIPFYDTEDEEAPPPLDKDEVRKKSLNYELEQAIVSQEYKIFLDNTLPEYQEKFIAVMIPSQTFFNIERGDVLTIERTLFPSPEEDIGVKEKIEKELAKYIHPDEFIVKVNFLKGIEETGQDGKKEASFENEIKIKKLRMQVVILLNDTVVPEADSFVRRTISLTVNFDEERGDELLVQREQFPEKEGGGKVAEEIARQEKVQDLQKEIVKAFERGEYAQAMELVNKSLEINPIRQKRLELLKMKGSLHFLLQEKNAARQIWEQILRLEPGNKEATEMLN